VYAALPFAFEEDLIVMEKRAAGLNERELRTFSQRACRAAGLDGEITVLITGDAELRRLNRTFRHKDKPKDVLSFPATCVDLAGDIAISIDTAAKNARVLGHSLTKEVKILILHGILHLAGHDHENDDGEMARREMTLRARLGLPHGLIERTLTRKNVRRSKPRRELSKSAAPRRTPA
jgi:probable rRNA maturation factor